MLRLQKQNGEYSGDKVLPALREFRKSRKKRLEPRHFAVTLSEIVMIVMTSPDQVDGSPDDHGAVASGAWGSRQRGTG